MKSVERRDEINYTDESQSAQFKQCRNKLGFIERLDKELLDSAVEESVLRLVDVVFSSWKHL